MPAGDSARTEARRQLELAHAHRAAADEALAAAGRYGVAAETERRTARVLSRLSSVGYVLLADRRWPGSRHAQVDLVIIGPGGVFILDTKAWKDVTIHAGRIHRGQEDVTDDVMALADLGSTVEADLAEVGLAPGEVRPVVVLAGRQGIDKRIGPVRIVGERDVLSHITDHRTRLTPHQVDTVLSRALALFPQVGNPAPVNVAVPEPVIPSQPTGCEQDALLTLEEINDALLEAVLPSPIEEWMSFLHPNQAKLVRRTFNGPSRIRGSAGTGKTVVGLHRAAYLARTRPGAVLVTTFVRTLPEVMRQMLTRMAPEVVDKVEFSGVHGFALRLLKDRGVAVKLDPRRATAAFERAWLDVGRTGLLGESRLSRRYWEEEVHSVLRGRGITDFAQYADLSRTGRKHRLTLEQRRAVWALHVAYAAELRKARVHDYADVILLAEAELRRQPLTGHYSAVIVDEAQDLSCAMVRMLYGLVGDAPDGFTLIGDGQQSIYPGGYTLAELGISLAGRGVVMDINYRNTAQILAFASRMVAGDEFSDIEGAVARGDVPHNVPRTGAEPVIERCATVRERDGRLVQRARAIVRETGTRPGDIGVLCVSSAGARRAADVLRAAGAPVVMLENYDGTPVQGIRVGTIKRAKGLEFKQVLLTDVRRDQVGDVAPPEDSAERERWELLRRELYVGMTRARDGLWVGVV